MRLRQFFLASILSAMLFGSLAKFSLAEPPNERNQRLLHAADTADLEGVKAALKGGANVDVKTTDGFTALERAARVGNDARRGLGNSDNYAEIERRAMIIRLLIEKGANLREIKYPHVIFNDLMSYEYFAVAKLMIDRSSDPEGAALWGAIRSRSVNKSYEPMRRRIFDDALAKVTNKGWLPQALTEAIYSPDAAYYTRKLLAKGANPNQKDYRALTPLLAAILTENPEVVQLLIAKGADVNQPYVMVKSAYLMIIDKRLEQGIKPLALAERIQTSAAQGRAYELSPNTGPFTPERKAKLARILQLLKKAGATAS